MRGSRRSPAWLAACLAAALAGAAAGTAQEPDEQPGGFDLLQRVRETYSGLVSYRDRGTLEIRREGAAAGPTRLEIRTEYDRDGRFELTLTPPSPAAPRTLVRAAADASDPAAFAAELHAALDPFLGDATGDALVAQTLLALGSSALADPEAAGVEGFEPCGDSTCRILAGSRAGGREAFRFWVGVGDDLVRRVDLELAPAPGSSGGATRIRVDLSPEADAGAPTVTARAPNAQEPPVAAFSEQLEVALDTVVVRVLDDDGNPVPDLRPEDFRVRVGREEVAVESADWIGSNVAADSLLEQGPDAPGDLGEPPPPRLFVFFVQADFEPSRMSGQVRMLAQAKRLVDDLRIDDRAAVVSYDTHLKLRQDFTDDHERLREALDAAIRFGREPWIRPGREPSIARHFEPAAARAATTPERGLELTARALIPIPGDKIVVYLGWGLGELTPLGVEMIPAYFDALRALRAARAAVFVLDVTDADYHSLEVGLEKVAVDTGGTYSKTHQFPVGATDRLLHLVAGYYLIGFHRPTSAKPGAEVRIELRDPRRGTLVQGR